MKLLKLLLCIVFCASLALVAYAHPGRTDKNGGHYVSGSGEYHYHHGYPAHDHKDMDDDGIPDCPYQFKDNTIEKEAWSSKATSPTTAPTEEPPQEKPKRTFEYYVTIVCIVFFGSLVLLELASEGISVIKRKSKK